MPIYAYRCSTCGYAQDVLQKMSDPLLSVCPNCGAATFVKQVTAAGFQLKGSGWYVTDFRGDNKKSGKATEGDAAGDGAKVEAVAKADKADKAGDDAGKKSETPTPPGAAGATAAPASSSPSAAPASAPASSPAPAPAPSGKTDS